MGLSCLSLAQQTIRLGSMIRRWGMAACRMILFFAPFHWEMNLRMFGWLDVVRMGVLRGEGLLYISIYRDDLIVAVDPNTLTVVGRTEVGSTPYDIGFVRTPDGQLKLVVTNFDDASVSIVEAGEPGEDSLRHSAVVR